MADKRIVYQGEDGIAKIVVPAPKFLASGGTIDDLLIKSVPENCRDTADIVDVDAVESDRTFRNAWVTEQGKSVEVDLDKSKVIAIEKVRQARTPKFQELDVAYQRADEDGDKNAKAAVVVKKQTARDATEDSQISGADSVANLKTGMEAVIKTVGDL
jgi:hypothetical protein|tara:strand:- start:293 stop:766 length:474 start_codon:yes stop_codon:yes gene_type:complete